MVTRCWTFAIVFTVLMSGQDFRLERQEVPGGAELLTVFAHFSSSTDSKSATEPETEVPVVSLLRDTLGDSDPQNDRLRYVWVLTSASPSLLQRAAAALPFYYWHADLGKRADHTPPPVIDLGSTQRSVWTSVAGSIAQVAALDPEGAIVRSATRRYRSNSTDQSRLRLLEGLAVLSQLEDAPEVRSLLSEPDLIEAEARMTLAGQPYGGLVGDEKLPEAYMKQRTRTDIARGHNWELLRQRAELNGLYFQPLGIGSVPTHALLWIATEDLASSHKYDPQFLGIADPYKDDRLRTWTGYRTIRDGREMIPLALYSLEYPKVPLLVVDFRDSHAPKRREMIRRAATDTISGVLGISMWSNWPLLAGATTFNFIRERHGAANDHASRIKSYSATREWLTMDQSVDPVLRKELMKKLEMLGVNPLEDSLFDQEKIARKQYAALLKYAEDPNGLTARLIRDRNEELEVYRHSFGERAGFHLAHWLSFGAYSHREAPPENLTAMLDEERRARRNVQFLQTVARSTSDPKVVWNMAEVRRAIDDLSASGFPARSAQVVEKIMRQTSDDETRQLCQRALFGLDAGQ